MDWFLVQDRYTATIEPMVSPPPHSWIDGPPANVIVVVIAKASVQNKFDLLIVDCFCVN